jgi:hypothetical protein
MYEKLIKAYRVGCPLISIETSDPGKTKEKITEAFGGMKNKVNVIFWDCVQGAVSGANSQRSTLKAPTDYQGSPMDLLVDIAALPVDFRAVIVLVNAHAFLDNFMVVQAIWNLRDIFKVGSKSLIMLGNGAAMPSELQHDVVCLSEPLPNAQELSAVIGGVCKSAEITLNAEVQEAAGNAALGVTSFAAENLTSLAISMEDKQAKFSMGELWESKRKKIDETPALQVVTGGSLDEIGGVKQAKKFIGQVLKGKGKPNCIVYIDEIEKQLGGLGGDTSGTSQDQLGQLLAWMQDHKATGCILVGPPGAVKSKFAKAAGQDAGIPTIQLDLGAAKGSLVGESEKKIREALKVVDAVSGGKTLWIVTCNSLAVLPPELKRRFKLGIWYFDLPDAEERREIWKIYQKKYQLKDKQVAGLLDEEWTGAEIEACCDIAWQLDIEPSEAAEYIVPVSKQAAETIEKLRAGAENRFLSATAPGTYQRKREKEIAVVQQRRFE